MHASVETVCQAIYLRGEGELKQELGKRHEAGANRPQTPRRQGPQTPFHEPMAMISGDPGDGTRQSQAIGRAIPSPAAATKAPSARSSSTTQIRSPPLHPTGTTPNTSAGHHRQDAAPAQTPAQQPDTGPGAGTRPAQTDRRLAGRMAVYFCDRTPRGSAAPGENTGRLLRQYFPGSTCLSSTRRTTSRSPRNSTTGHTSARFLKPSEKMIELLDAA